MKLIFPSSMLVTSPFPSTPLCSSFSIFLLIPLLQWDFTVTFVSFILRHGRFCGTNSQHERVALRASAAGGREVCDWTTQFAAIYHDLFWRPPTANLPSPSLAAWGRRSVMGAFCARLHVLCLGVAMATRSPEMRGFVQLQEAEGMALWIDEDQVKLLNGIPMDIYAILDGHVLPYIREPSFEKYLPTIPSEIEHVNFTWKSGKNRLMQKIRCTQDCSTLNGWILFKCNLMFTWLENFQPCDVQHFSVDVAETKKRRKKA
uniref:WIF domain-containing protein n=1 Tax=Strigamia maritima TaxID=126957 RepID=T1J9M4_STRMM